MHNIQYYRKFTQKIVNKRYFTSKTTLIPKTFWSHNPNTPLIDLGAPSVRHSGRARRRGDIENAATATKPRKRFNFHGNPLLVSFN